MENIQLVPNALYEPLTLWVLAFFVWGCTIDLVQEIRWRNYRYDPKNPRDMSTLDEQGAQVASSWVQNIWRLCLFVAAVMAGIAYLSPLPPPLASMKDGASYLAMTYVLTAILSFVAGIFVGNIVTQTILKPWQSLKTALLFVTMLALVVSVIFGLVWLGNSYPAETAMVQEWVGKGFGLIFLLIATTLAVGSIYYLSMWWAGKRDIEL